MSLLGSCLYPSRHWHPSVVTLQNPREGPLHERLPLRVSRLHRILQSAPAYPALQVQVVELEMASMLPLSRHVPWPLHGLLADPGHSKEHEGPKYPGRHFSQAPDEASTVKGASQEHVPFPSLPSSQTPPTPDPPQIVPTLTVAAVGQENWHEPP